MATTPKHHAPDVGGLDLRMDAATAGFCAGDGELELLTRWQAGDQHAGDALIRAHFWRIYRFFRAKLDSAAEDLTQRTFLAAVEARDRVDARLSFRAYLFGIARYQLTQYLRRHARTQARFEPSQNSVAEITGQVDAKMAHVEEQRALMVALRRIPLDHQITIELYYWEEMSVAEIASVLDIAPGTVKSRLGRARAELRRQLGRERIRREAKESTLSDLEGWATSLRDVFGR